MNNFDSQYPIKKPEIVPHREEPTPLKPSIPGIDPGKTKEIPTEPNPSIPEREAEPEEPPTKPGDTPTEIDIDEK